MSRTHDALNGGPPSLEQPGLRKMELLAGALSEAAGLRRELNRLQDHVEDLAEILNRSQQLQQQTHQGWTETLLLNRQLLQENERLRRELERLLAFTRGAFPEGDGKHKG
jgi:hypothetical protein